MTAPRITELDVESNIVTTEFIVMPDGRTTVCHLTLVNGYTLRGEASCVSIENFDAELGQKYAREDAVRKIWPLMGYALAERLYFAKAIATKG